MHEIFLSDHYISVNKNDGIQILNSVLEVYKYK